jgi:hypothetical protein
MEQIQQYVIAHKGKDHRSLLKLTGLISLMFICTVLLMTYTFPFFDFISKKQGSFEEGYHGVPSGTQQTQAHSGILDQRRERVLIQPSEITDSLSAQAKNVLISYMLFGKALRGFKRDGKKEEDKGHQ